MNFRREMILRKIIIFQFQLFIFQKPLIKLCHATFFAMINAPVQQNRLELEW